MNFTAVSAFLVIKFAKSPIWNHRKTVALPSGNLTKSYGKSPFFMGKSTISMAIFYVAMLVYQRVYVVVTIFEGLRAPRSAGTLDMGLAEPRLDEKFSGREVARQCVAGTHVMWQRQSRDHRPWKRMWDGDGWDGSWIFLDALVAGLDLNI